MSSSSVSYWSRAPQARRKVSKRLDNLALVPASELASLQSWQAAARQLPAGDVLVVVPSDNLQLQEVGRQIDSVMSERGHHSRLRKIPPPPHR